MILSGQSIRARGILHPFHERTHHSGMTFGVGPAGYDVRIGENITLEAGDFALASTIERFVMPSDLLAIVHDKSTWARMGVTVQNTVIEPGWRGFLTLEITNHSREVVRLRSGQPIAQIVFHVLDQTTERPYSGKYQDQPEGPQLALFDP